MKNIVLNAILLFFYGIINRNGYNQLEEKVKTMQEENTLMETVENMSIEEKVGQVLLARVPLNNSNQMLQEYHLGGYLLFERDVIDLTALQIQQKIDGWNRLSKIPLIFAIDEEGGTVSRLKRNYQVLSSPFKSPQELFQEGGYPLLAQDTISKNALLASLHINVNLAPVADVSLNPYSYIYKRTFGRSAEETATYIQTVIEACKSTNVSCTLKHFPGYGENVDTHQGMAYDNRSLDELRKKDFLPFQAGIQAGVDLILVNHNIYTQIDANNPATLSLKIHQILKDELGYNGLIITDDLEMNAIKQKYNKPYIQAFNALNDILIVTDIKGAYNELLGGVKSGEIQMATLNKAVYRILKWKKEKNMFS